MTRGRRSLAWLAAPVVLLGAFVAFIAATLPPRAVVLPGALPDTLVMGAYHIHTRRSDGSGTVDDVMTAAANAGLRFVIITDHGDAMRTPDPPAYRHGVLEIDAVEVSTLAGHIVALGLDRPSPYPLAGTPRDVIEDIHRLGGAAVVAHPDSPRAGLRYGGTDEGFDGIEWLNADTEWRDESAVHLAATAARGILRPSEAVASLFRRPAASIARWDRAAATRPVFGLAALDAHARLGWRMTDEPRGWTLARQPSYEAMFRALADVVVLDTPLSGDARSDAARIIAAIRAGHVYGIVRAFAGPASIEFAAAQANRAPANGGDRLPAAVDTVFRVRVPEWPSAALALVRGREVVAAGQGTLSYETSRPGVYRAEAQFGNRAVPWLMSNPITIGLPTTAPAVEPAHLDLAAGHVIALPANDGHWDVEREPFSSGEMRVADDGVTFTFHLGDGAAHGQYAALVHAVPEDTGVTGIRFAAHANAPMRVSVQVRLGGERVGERWRRSVYVGPETRTVDVPIGDFDRADGDTSNRLDPSRIPAQSLLFVVDTLNTKPGTGGTVTIGDVQVAAR
jgi:hypothetical protein